MKANRILTASVLTGVKLGLLGPNASKDIRASIVALAAVALLLVNGCASVYSQGDADPWRYNPNTGYPLVGGPSLGRF